MSYIVSNAAKEALSALLADEKVARAVAFAEADQPRCLEEHIRLTEIEAPTYEESASILNTATDEGICSFDTARAYGESEAVLGRYFKENFKQAKTASAMIFQWLKRL